MTALAFGDEQPTLPGTEVTKAQPEDLAPAQAAQEHRFDHRPITLGPKCGEEGVSLVWIDDSRQRARCPDQWHAPHGSLARPSHRQPTRDRVLLDRCVAADDQVFVQARDRGQSALDRAGRQPLFPVFDPYDRRALAGLSLSLDEPEHVSSDDLAGLLVDHGEEDLQIEGRREHSVGTSPCSHQIEVGIEQRIAEPDQLASARTAGTDQAWCEGHRQAPIEQVSPAPEPGRPGKGSPAYRDQSTQPAVAYSMSARVL
jgi:hypothetical protein